MENNETNESAGVRVEIFPNGPLVIFGDFTLKDAEGNLVARTNKTSFCRCGASSKKPFCDGTHRSCGFVG